MSSISAGSNWIDLSRDLVFVIQTIQAFDCDIRHILQLELIIHFGAPRREDRYVAEYCTQMAPCLDSSLPIESSTQFQLAQPCK